MAAPPARMEARWRPRRIIYNNDGDDALLAGVPGNLRPGGSHELTLAEHEHDRAEGLTVRATDDIERDFLAARSTPLVGSQVDSYWFASCMAGLTFSHHTRLGGWCILPPHPAIHRPLLPSPDKAA
eukprot:COSAG04_NODE_21218_length_378_cov_0.555556_1_plen_125_part_11